MVQFIDSNNNTVTVNRIMEKVNLLCTVSVYQEEKPAGGEPDGSFSDLNAFIEIQTKRPQQVAQLSKSKVFVKKLIRKLVAWYAADLVEQQNQYNDAVYRNLIGMQRELYEMREKRKDAHSEEYQKFCTEMRRRFSSDKADVIDRFTLYKRQFSKNREAILQIGCGTGEFLEFMAENGAYGISCNGWDYQICKSKQLNVYFEDPVHHLRCLKDDSLGSVLFSRESAPMSKACLLEMCQLLHQKMKKGGILITETANAGTCCSLYHEVVDNSAVLSSEALKLFLEYAGFQMTDMDQGKYCLIGHNLK